MKRKNADREERARSIAKRGLVNRENDFFRVSESSPHDSQISYRVKRDTRGKIRCNCWEFVTELENDPNFRCEHMMAIKFALIEKNTESATKILAKQETTVSKTLNKNATEQPKSKSCEQKTGKFGDYVSVNGQIERKTDLGVGLLAKTRGENKMIRNKQNDQVTNAVEKSSEIEQMADEIQEIDVENLGNVFDFPNEATQSQRSNGLNFSEKKENANDVDGLVSVVDLLNESTPNWNHAVKEVRQIDKMFVVTVALMINNIKREGIGTGIANSEAGIEKAELDALKNAAVKFGIGRELSKINTKSITNDPSTSVKAFKKPKSFPANPIAKSLADLVTAKQLNMILKISAKLGIDANDESENLMNCQTGELSKSAASSLIEYLHNFQPDRMPLASPMRLAS